MVLEAIKYERGSLKILDQLQLPHKIAYDEVHTSEDSWHAIRDMRVRGAPAIAMVGILGLAIEVDKDLSRRIESSAEAAQVIAEKLDYIVTSRPTAVNLKNMAQDFKKLTQEAARKSGRSANGVWEAYLSAAEETLHVDRRDNQRLGDLGAKWIVEQSNAGNIEPVTVLTHCNTGSLATAGYGTALGVVRSLHSLGKLRRAYCTETRPYNQGSRLTAFELVHDQIPAKLITDSMAAALLKLKKESEHIAAIVVGADRIAANGDTANKIGTYALAIAARHHGVKFLVAAPCSTVDLHTASGEDITIEERAGSEMTSISGPVVTAGKLDLDTPAKRVSIAAAGIDVWNPAFDVTPADLIDGIVTEKGVAEKHGAAAFDMAKFVNGS